MFTACISSFMHMLFVNSVLLFVNRRGGIVVRASASQSVD